MLSTRRSGAALHVWTVNHLLRQCTFSHKDISPRRLASKCANPGGREGINFVIVFFMGRNYLQSARTHMNATYRSNQADDDFGVWGPRTATIPTTANQTRCCMWTWYSGVFHKATSTGIHESIIYTTVVVRDTGLLIWLFAFVTLYSTPYSTTYDHPFTRHNKTTINHRTQFARRCTKPYQRRGTCRSWDSHHY